MYTTSAMSSHTLPCTNTQVNYYMCSAEGFSGVYPPLHFALRLLLLPLQTLFASPDCVYHMHFTHYSVQWRLTKLQTKYSQFLLNDSTSDEQQPRIQVHFEFVSKLRISDHRLHIEKGRYTIPPTPVEKRICQHYSGIQIKDESHFLLDCQ